MKLANPQEFEFTHPNFNGQSVKVSLNQSAEIGGFLELKATGVNGATGYAQLQFQDNGTVVVRIDEDPSNLFTALVV